jgi:uncharacterized protein YjcR
VTAKFHVTYGSDGWDVFETLSVAATPAPSAPVIQFSNATYRSFDASWSASAGGPVTEYKVRAWRDKNKLQSNFLKQREFDEKKAMKLYEKGMTDVEIGKELGRSTTTIYNWRTRAGLDANRIKTKLLKEKQELRIRLYREGKSDREIAEQTGTTISTVRAWRQYHKLKANDQRQACRYDRDLMREYYMRGMNDSQISAKLGCHSGTVGEWRKKEGLTKNRIRTKKRMSE